MEKVLYLEQGEKYGDRQEGYFMVPNWLFDEGEYIELDVYERMALIYIIRCVNKKDNSKGKGDIFFLSADNLSRKCNFSLGKAKKVLNKLQDHGYIKKIRTGNNLMKKANSYKVMNLQPKYVQGIEISLSEAKEKLSEDEFNELLLKGNGTFYYYEDEERYSHRKLLPLIVNCFSGEIGCFIDD